VQALVRTIEAFEKEVIDEQLPPVPDDNRGRRAGQEIGLFYRVEEEEGENPQRGFEDDIHVY
jgi:hypothetical protein